MAATAYATIKLKKRKPTEKSLSSLVNSRVRARLSAVWDGQPGCPYLRVPDNMDRRRLASCSGFFAHAWMLAPGRAARLGIAPRQMTSVAFQKVILYRMGLPIPADDGRPGARVCRCGVHGDDMYGHHSLSCKGDGAISVRHDSVHFAFHEFVRECGVAATTGLRNLWPHLNDPLPGMEGSYTADTVLRN